MMTLKKKRGHNIITHKNVNVEDIKMYAFLKPKQSHSTIWAHDFILLLFPIWWTVIVGMNGDNNNDCCVLALGGDIANCNEENYNDKKIYRTH